MEPLHLQSETEVYSYFKTFLANKTKAVQLDGSSTPVKSEKVMIIFQYSVDGQSYKLLGDLTRKAMKHFIVLSDEHGSPALALKEYKIKGQKTLILADTKSPDGWHCALFIAKSSDRLKRSA